MAYYLQRREILAVIYLM